MRRTFYTAIFFFSLAKICVGNTLEINIRDLGATGKKEQLVTTIIQKAIDSAYFAGGGKVIIPEGEYLSGTIILKANVNLHIEKNATLFASRNINDYRIPLMDLPQPAFIYSNKADNISITGEGVIDGQAERVYEDLKSVDKFIADITENARASGVEMKMYYKVPPTPYLVFLLSGKNILVKDITLRESNYWTLHLINCRDINIENAKVFSSLESGVNADGIDLNGCMNVVVQGCTVRTGDDAICLKSWHIYDQPCENIHVKNCVLSSSSTALKIGTESYHDFRNITFEDCLIEDANRGMSIVVRDGGHVENVRFENITVICTRRHFNWWGNADPIWIYLDKRGEKSKIGSIRDIHFENIIALGQGTSKIETEFMDSIQGIHMKNVSLMMNPEVAKDIRVKDAIFFKNVKTMDLKLVFVSWNPEKPCPKWESAIEFENCEEVLLGEFHDRNPYSDTIPSLYLHNCKTILIRNPGFHWSYEKIKIEGADSKNIKIESDEKIALEIDPSIAKDEIIFELKP